MSDEEGIVVEVDADYVKKYFMSPPALVMLDSASTMVEQRALVVGRNFLQYSDIASAPSIAAVIFKQDDGKCIKSKVVPCTPGGYYLIQVEGGGLAGADIRIEQQGMRCDKSMGSKSRTLSLVMSRDKAGNVFVSEDCLTNMDEITEELHVIFRYPRVIDCIAAIVQNPHILAKAHDGTLGDTPHVIQAGGDGIARPPAPQAPVLPARLRSKIGNPAPAAVPAHPSAAPAPYSVANNQPTALARHHLSAQPFPSTPPPAIFNSSRNAPPQYQENTGNTRLLPKDMFANTDTSRPLAGLPLRQQRHSTKPGNPYGFQSVATSVPPVFQQQQYLQQQQYQQQQSQQHQQQQRQPETIPQHGYQHYYDYAPAHAIM